MKKRIDVTTWAYVATIVIIYFLGTTMGLTQEVITASNFDNKIAEFKDIKIDNKINQNINKILNNVFFKKEYLQNKIYFKNLLNEAIKSYAG